MGSNSDELSLEGRQPLTKSTWMAAPADSFSEEDARG